MRQSAWTSGGLALRDVEPLALAPGWARLPAGVSPLVASMAERLAVATRAAHRAHLKLDSRVFIIGAGAIGLLVGLLARDSAGRVAIVTRHAHQTASARAMGLEPVAEAE